VHRDRDVLDVRRDDADPGDFADRIVELLAFGPPLLVDISRHTDHGTRITLHVTAQEPRHDPA